VVAISHVATPTNTSPAAVVTMVFGSFIWSRFGSYFFHGTACEVCSEHREHKYL
jgi:hypothetical protein